MPRPKPPETKICRFCHNPFLATNRNERRRSCCSDDCAKARARRPIKPPIIKFCTNCHQPFIAYTAAQRHHACCSQTCADARQAQLRFKFGHKTTTDAVRRALKEWNTDPEKIRIKVERWRQTMAAHSPEWHLAKIARFRQTIEKCYRDPEWRKTRTERFRQSMAKYFADPEWRYKASRTKQEIALDKTRRRIWQRRHLVDRMLDRMEKMVEIFQPIETFWQ